MLQVESKLSSYTLYHSLPYRILKILTLYLKYKGSNYVISAFHSNPLN